MVDDPVYGDRLNPFIDHGRWRQPALFRCPDCTLNPRMLSARFDAFFEGVALPCPGCGREIDLWRDVPAAALPEFVGARWHTDAMPIEPGEVWIRLSEFDVPPEATVLRFDIGTAPSLRTEPPKNGAEVEEPVEVPPLLQLLYPEFPASGRFPHQVLAVAHDPHGDASPTNVQVLISWVPPNKHWQWGLLVDAVAALSHLKLREAIMWASTAVESVVAEMIEGFFEHAGVGRDHRERLLEEAGFGGQLNALLPLLFNGTRVHRMSDDLRGRLNQLRKARNRIIHGRPVMERYRDAEKDEDTEVRVLYSVDDAADMVKAAVFGIHYIRYADAAMRPEQFENA